MTFEFNGLTYSDPPRDREVLMAELRSAFNGDAGFKLWKLVTELEEGAWRGGFDEGYRHGHHDGQEILHAANE